MIDVEADGPIPGEYSMIQLGAIIAREPLDKAPTFFGQLAPISNMWIPDALKVSGLTREETLQFEDPASLMLTFNKWVKANNKGKKPMFISDNNGFDWMFVCYYFHKFLGENPFGHSSTNLGSLYKGMIKDTFKNFKHLRQTRHTHNPVDDARGNAEALIKMKHMGLNIVLE